MFELTNIGVHTSEDCTSKFACHLDKAYTVQDFVNTVLLENASEWGFIGIYAGCYSSYGNPVCKYTHGILTSQPLPNEILECKVKNVTASGGYIEWTI